MKKIVLSLLALMVVCGCFGKITLPKVVGSNMVLQRNTNVNLWGESSPNAKIAVTTSWNNKTYNIAANRSGNWKVAIATGKEGGPYSITISDGQKTTLDNILLGEVWICSGQSNMEMPVKGYPGQPTDRSAETILEARQYPDIRMFTVRKHSATEPQNDCTGGEWLLPTPVSVGDFSATAYFFGKALNQTLGIPIGLISTNWGGSAIETWMSEENINSIAGINREIAFSGKNDNNIPARLYNGMILPIADYTAKGFIWYQGESNRHNPKDYPALMTAMVEEWRTAWGDDKMPFYYVQIAPYFYDRKTDGFDQPMIVEAQYKALESIPYSGIAATTDIGHKSCIHPPQKNVVGRRLAYLALSKDYGLTGFAATPPRFRSMDRDDSKLVLTFDHLSKPVGNDASNSFATFDRNDTVVPEGFEIAGEDRVFYPAKADFRRDDILVYSESVPEPVAVRYAFRNVPNANVMTVADQPLPSFRTDNWPVEFSERR